MEGIQDPTTNKRKGGVYEGEKEVEEEDDDTTVCPRCHQDQKTKARYYTHIKKFHKDIFNFVCEKCDKGMVTKEGLKMHMKTHDEKAKIKCTVAGCKSECSTRKSLKHHLRIYHPAGGMQQRQCPHPPCTKQFKTKSNLVQHQKSCKHNPNRVELFCEVCGKGNFYSENKKQEHKRDIHHWR